MFRRLFRAFRLAWKWHNGIPQNIERAQIIELKRDDLVVLRSESPLTDVQFTRLQSMVQELLPNHTPMLLEGIDLYVIRDLA